MTSTGLLTNLAIALMLALPAGAQVAVSGSGSTAGSLVRQVSANTPSLERSANRPVEETGSQSATTSTAGVVASASVARVRAAYIPPLLISGASRRNDQLPMALSADATADDDDVLAGGPKSTIQNFAGTSYAGVVSNASASEPAIVSLQ
jgi:hypothetical protein